MKATIDTTKPHPARMYDYYLGGKDHFAADRETAQQALNAFPTLRTAASVWRRCASLIVSSAPAPLSRNRFLIPVG